MPSQHRKHRGPRPPQYGFIVSAVAYGWVYGKNALAWRRAAIHDGEAA